MAGGAAGAEGRAVKVVKGVGDARCGVEWDCLGLLGLCLFCRDRYIAGVGFGKVWELMVSKGVKIVWAEMGYRC